MAYKTSFKPLERLGRDGWRRMDELSAEPAPAFDPMVLPVRRERRRLTVDA